MGFNSMHETVKPIEKQQIHRILSLLMISVLLCCFFPVHALAGETAANGSKHIVRVGYFPTDGFQEYDEETGVYSGYSYEFLMAIAAYTDWQYEFVHCDTFTEAMTMLENGEIDLLNDVTKTEDREGTIEYSSLNSGDACLYLLMHDSDNRVAFNDWENIGGINIGLDKESIHSQTLLSLLAEKGVTPHVTWFDNEPEMIAAWNAGTIDAFPANSDTAIDGHAVMIFAPGEYYIATTKGNTDLIHEVDVAIQSLRANAPGFEATIFNKYYNRVSRNYSALTKEEQEYIRENPVVHVLYIPDWYPISYTDENGEFAGPFKQIYALLQERTGLQFEFVPKNSNTPFEGIVETFNCYMLAEHPADYIGAASLDVKLTQTFVSAALVEVTKGTLKQGDTIALVEGDCLSEVAKRLFGDEFEYSMENSIEDCLAKVQDGSVAGTFLMSYESEYYQSKRQYRNLIYTVVNDGSYGFGLAVSNQADPLLYSIIVKGLNSISSGEVNNIFNQMTQELQKPSLWDTVLDNPLPFLIGAIAIAGLLVFAVSALFFSRKIKEKNDELIRANAATTRFFSRMSHDMRTPMNGILGIAELSKSDNDTETLHGEMEKIQQSGKYLLSLINDTLDFQRIESGNLRIEKEIVNYKDVLQNITELVSQSAKSKNIDFRIMSRLSVPDSYVWADPVRLKQIFINLLSNAIKFTPAGGTVTVEYKCREQSDTVFHDRFYIRDTGIGMSQEYIDTNMFQPFCQEHNEVTGQYAGSGLGLSIVKSLTDLMGGTISVESELGTGTTFIVDLDFEKASAEEIKQLEENKKTKDENVVHSLAGTKILLVEDHPLNAEIAMRLLKKVGCNVEWTKNGQEGVDAFSNSPEGFYHLILMDIRMPVMDGYEAAKHIRAMNREDAKTVPIIAMTANAYESDVKECMDAGMNEHIAKPIEPQKLYEAIARN